MISRLILLCTTLLVVSVSFAQKHLPFIPAPKEIKWTKKYVDLGDGIGIVSDSSHTITQEFLSEVLNSARISAEIGHKDSLRAAIPLKFNIDTTLAKEAYSLFVSNKKIELVAGSEAGLVWGIQTLHQAIYNSTETINGSRILDGFKMSDEPSYQHRGLLLDCCRHFFSVETVKKYIDLLSFYKMNVLHWHLTEDQGWRIEIDAYPNLTEIGAWRTEADGSRYGGFYTKEEIREVVSYAAQRGITVIPEIEMPGHAQAALAAYPEFSCIGQNIEVVNDWGVFKEIYCAGNDSMFSFLETVLDEVMELFPSKYIHIGGDEAPKFRWENCAKCQKRIEQEGLEDAHALQSYFITRIEKYLNSKGRILIGWDEILEGGLAPNAVLQSWRGMNHGMEAAEMNHQVIMSPTSHCYLDYGLDAIDLKKIYDFNPIPEGISRHAAQNIIGGECNMWTEHVPNDSVLAQRVFPRMIGLSTVLWEGDSKRAFQPFYDDLQFHYRFLSDQELEYGLEGIPATVSVNQQDGKTMVALEAGVPDLKLKYSYGNMENQIYSEPFSLDQTAELKVSAFKEDMAYGTELNTPLNYHNALSKKVAYTSAYSHWYEAGGDFGLVDGLTGSLNFRDGHWQGFSGVDVSAVIDLESKQRVASVSANFYQYNNAWIFFPSNIEVFGSKDGEKWVSLGNAQTDVDEKERGKFIFTALISPKSKKKFRYIRLDAKNIQTVPEWHEAAGSEAWIFIDEIIVK